MALLHYFKDDIKIIKAFLDHPKFLKYSDQDHVDQLVAFAEQVDSNQIKQALSQYIHNLN